jgi:hypothetical protein
MEHERFSPRIEGFAPEVAGAADPIRTMQRVMNAHICSASAQFRNDRMDCGSTIVMRVRPVTQSKHKDPTTVEASE